MASRMSSSGRSPVAISLMPAAVRPRSVKPFMKAMVSAPGGRKMNTASGLVSLDLLQEGGEVGVLHRRANFADDFAAGRGEGLLELAFGIVAGAVVGDQGEHLLDLVLRRPARDRRGDPAAGSSRCAPGSWTWW